MTTTIPPPKENLHALRSILRLFWGTKTSYYSDENMLAALVHTVPDSLEHLLGPGMPCLAPRAPVSFILTHLANIEHF